MSKSLSEFESLIFQYGRACREAALGCAPESKMHETFGELHRAIVDVVFEAKYLNNPLQATGSEKS